MTRFEAPLRRGDQVVVIAPASQLPRRNRELLTRGIELLELWGLTVSDRVEHSNHFYLAGTDETRAARLHDALGDHDIAAVFTLRGGYGTSRILRTLNSTTVRGPKIVIGYSDVTFLHAAAATLWPSVRPLYGPNIATAQLLDDSDGADMTRRALYAALFDGLVEPFEVDYLRPGRVTAPLLGGCLSCITALVGTPWFPNLDGAVLFIEDVGELPYKIDRMLTQLRDAGTLARLAGLVFGRMHNCTDQYNDLREVVLDAIGDVPYPVAFGLASGHGPVNRALPLGVDYTLDSDSGVVTIAPTC